MEFLNYLNSKKNFNYIIDNTIEIGTSDENKFFDARSAGFFAMGQALMKNDIVLIVRGEYLPSLYTVLTEAWFQKINLNIVAIYDNVYDVKNHYLNRCLVSNMMFYDYDVKKFKNKINKELEKIGPKLFSVITNEFKIEKEDYSFIFENLVDFQSEIERIYVYNSNNNFEKLSSEVINIDYRYKYGVISKYCAKTTSSTKCILVCNEECLKVDSNIFNCRYINDNFKIIVKVKDVDKYVNWFESNNIIVQIYNNSKDIEKFLTEKQASILMFKEEN